MLLKGVLRGGSTCIVLCFGVAHRSLSKCDRSRKYNNPNNKIIVINIITICGSVFQCDFREVVCTCNKESMSIECRGVAR